MVEYLVERYVSRSESEGLKSGCERARRAAEELSREGTSVLLVRSIFVPEDETCFYLYEAESSEAVLEAARRAELRVDRIATTVDSDGDRAERRD